MLAAINSSGGNSPRCHEREARRHYLHLDVRVRINASRVALARFHHAQFGIYEVVRKEIMSRKDEGQAPRSWLPPALRRTLGMDHGALQPDYFKDFLKNVRLMEEELV